MKRKNVFQTANLRYLKLMKAYWCAPKLASLHPGECAGAGRAGGRVRSPHPLPAPHLGPAKVISNLSNFKVISSLQT